MSSVDLAEIVQALFADDRGLLAMDESVGTCNKRLPKLGWRPLWKTGTPIAIGLSEHQN
jgi:fructose-bisphosphate aldolase class 1